jgi:hypothetical protein
MIDQLPKIPDDDEVVITETEVKQKPVTLSDLPPPGAILQRSLTDREIQALKNLGPQSINLLNEISKDLLPVWGEARAMDYTNKEIEGFKQAIEEGDVGGTITHGIGIPVMSAGSLPWWLGGGAGVGLGYMYRKGIMEGYRNLTSRFRKQQLDNPGIQTGTQNRLSDFEMRTLPGEQIRPYIQWLRGLPENRLSGTERMINTNLEEFRNTVVPNSFLMRELDASYGSTNTMTKIGNYRAQKKALLEEQERSEKIFAQGNLPTKIGEKFNYGESKNPIRQGSQQNVSEFTGSRAYDVIAAENFKNMNPTQITNRIINLIKTGKVSREEIFDAGILKLDENFKPIGGALANLPKEFKNIGFNKQDILKMLKNAPASRLKINTYGGGVVPLGDDFYDLYASTDRMGNSLKMMLEEQIFKTTNTAQRGQLNKLQEKIKQLESGLTNKASASPSRQAEITGWGDDLEILTTALPTLPDGAQQILRGYISNIQKLKPYISAQKKRGFKGKTQHDSVTTKGGYDYQEKVIYLDEAIPFNSEKGKKVFSSHFKEPNPTVHIRYKTRYNDKGQPVYAIEEIQSDTLQKFWDKGKKDMRAAMDSPYGKSLIEAIIKRKMTELNDAQAPLLNASKKRSLSDAEVKQLQKLDNDKSFLRKYFVRSELMDEAAIKKVSDIVRKDTNKNPDFFPYMKSYYELALKTMVDDAIRSGKAGVSIVPVAKNTHHTKDKGHYLYYGDNKGTKVKGMDQTALPPPGKKKSALAVYPATLEKIAKQIKADHGITLNVKRTKMFNEPSTANRPYQILDQDGELIASFKTKANRDYILDKKNAGAGKRGTVDFEKEFVAKDITAGPKSDKEAFWGYTLEIPPGAAKQLSKKKMRTYKTGGLVAIQPKREYFAPIF